MKFKENAIKPDMVIHCPKEEDAVALLTELDGIMEFKRIENAYEYAWEKYKSNTCYWHTGRDVYRDEYSNCKAKGYDITEFADLIEPVANKANNLANEMSTAEVLEWLRDNDGKQAMKDVFGCTYYNSVMDNNTGQEVADKITAYEATKKEPKPVEVNQGWLCGIYDKEWHMVDEKEVWEGNEEHAKNEAAEMAKQYVIENGETAIYQVYGICKVKENK